MIFHKFVADKPFFKSMTHPITTFLRDFTFFSLQQHVMEIDIAAIGEQLRIFQDQYKEKSQEYDHLFKELNQTSQVQTEHNLKAISDTSNHHMFYLRVFDLGM